MPSGSQASLLHQRHDLFSEEFEIWQIIEEIDLNAIASGRIQFHEPIDNLFGSTDKMHVSSDHPLSPAVPPPRLRVAADKRLHKNIRCNGVFLIENRLIGSFGLLLRGATDDVRINDRLDLPAVFTGEALDLGVDRRKRFTRLHWISTSRTRNKDNIRMLGCVFQASI